MTRFRLDIEERIKPTLEKVEKAMLLVSEMMEYEKQGKEIPQELLDELKSLTKSKSNKKPK